MHLQIKLLTNGKTPTYGTSESAGLDLYAAITEEMTLHSFQRILVPCGFSMALPQGYEAQVRPRSGLALKHGITVLNTPGTIDSDYRGEVCVILINLSQDDFTITPDMRIAQMVVAKHESVICVAVKTLNNTQRDTAGFGSTGL